MRKAMNRFYNNNSRSKFFRIATKYLESDSDSDYELHSRSGSPALEALPALPDSPPAAAAAAAAAPSAEEFKEVDEATSALYDVEASLNEIMKDWHTKRSQAAASPLADEQPDEPDENEVREQVQEALEMRIVEVEKKITESLQTMKESYAAKQKREADENDGFRRRWPAYTKRWTEDSDIEQRFKNLSLSLEERIKNAKPYTQAERDEDDRRANVMNQAAQSKEAVNDALNSITFKHSKPTMALKAIVYGSKSTKQIDQKTEKLVTEYWNSSELKNIFMRQIPFRDRSKNSWNAFKEDVRYALGQEKLKLMQEKKGGDFMVFPHDSSSENPSSEEEEEVAHRSPQLSPNVRRLAEKFETPQASRSGTATRASASAAAAEPNSPSGSDSNDSFEPDFNSGDDDRSQIDSGDDDAGESSDEMKFIIEQSREAARAKGNLSVKRQLQLCNELLEAIPKSKDSKGTVRNWKFAANGSFHKSHGKGNISVPKAERKLYARIDMLTEQLSTRSSKGKKSGKLKGRR